MGASGARQLRNLLGQQWNGDLKLAVNKISHLNLVAHAGEINVTIEIIYGAVIDPTITLSLPLWQNQLPRS
jgi:hypothetical protein